MCHDEQARKQQKLHTHSLMQLLFTQHDIEARVRVLAGHIARDYRAAHPVLIGVLKGSFVFLADLMRMLSIPVTLDFVQISSYGAGTERTGTCRIDKDITLDISGRDVLVIEDIVDTGETLAFLLDKLRSENPSSLRVCALVDTHGRRTREIAIDYCGFTIENEFVVGYGLDFNERYRELPALYAYREP